MTASPWLDSPVKRAVDVVVAAVGLVVVAPAMALTALAVRARLGSPVLFHQERAGRHGQPFDVVKFRSMADADDADGHPLPDAERLDRFGRFLRATSLDELPQLTSVLRGQMTLIGPRPLPTKYVDRYSDEQRRRLEAVPGVTGWAQVHGRNTLDWPTRLAHDVWYVDHASPVIDAKILWLTVATVLDRRSVAADGHATMPEFLPGSTP